MDSFDEQAIPDLKSEALDFRSASEFFAPYRKLTPKAWSTLRVTTEHQGRQVPTIGGLLLFGKDRFSRFPDAWIQAGRFAGTDRARLVDSAEIRSLLPQAAEEAVAFARKHLTHESVIEGLRREERWKVWIQVGGRTGRPSTTSGGEKSASGKTANPPSRTSRLL
ncbi:MAG: hypothetical protein IT165_22185 [Bryobacterales bacterium]|nr:hypothetical protein [Bryobacterales bacterium]